MDAKSSTTARCIARSAVRRSSDSRKRADVLRASPASKTLRDAFRLETKRRQRQSDGTISLEGVRFEIPGRYRHFDEVAVRYARWDLRRVDLVDSRSGAILAPVYPLDRRANANGQRLLFELDAPARQPTTSSKPRGEQTGRSSNRTRNCHRF